MDFPIDVLYDLFTVRSDAQEIDLRKVNDHNVLVVCRDNDEFIDLVHNPYVLLPWDNFLMSGSPVCRKLAKSISSSQLGDINNITAYLKNTELLKSENIIICFPEMKEYLMSGYIETIDDFFEYIKFADRYMLNIPYICSLTDRMIWLLSIKERQKDLWRQNAIFLENIEQRLFAKPKFDQHNANGPVIPAVGGFGPYPVGNTAPTLPKFVAISEIVSPKFLSQTDFTLLITLLLGSNAHDFVSKMIAVLGPALEYYDVIFGNINVVNLLKSLPGFFQSMFYAFRIMYLEEVSMYYRKRGPGRFIMDIDTVAAYPNYSSIRPQDSPYFGTVVSNINFDAGLTLPAKMAGSRGVYTAAEFTQRMEIFTDGSLKHLEWNGENYKTALTGSSITACALKSPLEEFFNSASDYFEEYYPGRKVRGGLKILPVHVDVTQNAMFSMVDDSSDENEQNECNSPGESVDDTERIKIRKCIKDAKNTDLLKDENTDNPTGIVHKIDYTDVDLMVACKWEDFDAVADKHFRAVLCVHEYAEMELVKTENKHKYVITGLSRDIDIFHVDDIESVLVKYHLDCVRAWYDGNTVKCFPSFITAAKLGLNTHIRWTSNRKDVRDIVMKYFQRGFGTIINAKDKRSLIDYVNSSTQWPHIGPAPGGGWWRQRRYWREALFHNCAGAIFNPSCSKLGIHNGLNNTPHIINIGKIKQRKYEQRVYGRRSRISRRIFNTVGRNMAAKAGNAVKPTNDISLTADYKSEYGGVLLPMVCPTLSAYL